MSDKEHPLRTRAAVIELKPEGESVAIRAALSSNEPVPMFGGLEVLRHTVEAVDMTRAANGLPLTVNHSERGGSELPVGRVRGISLDDDGKMRGTLEFDTDEASQAVRGKVERGFAPDVSLTYMPIKARGPDESGVTEITRWMPMAASIVTMPADASVGIGRSATPTEDDSMPEEKTPGTEPSLIEKVRERSQAGADVGIKIENERIASIRSATDMLVSGLPSIQAEARALETEAVGDTSVTAEAYNTLLLNLISGAPREGASAPAATRGINAPELPGNRPRTITAGAQDGREAAHRGMELALLERVGGKVDADEMKGNHYRGWSIMDMVNESLTLAGVDVRGMTGEQRAKAAIQMRAISPGTANYAVADFPAVTESIAHKRVFDGFMEAPRTWEDICSTHEVADFRTFSVPRISAISDLPTVAENAAYQNLTQVDAKESATLVKKGGLFSLTWEAMLADDMSMFSRTATTAGEAAQRTIETGFYAFLAANGNMGDGNPLFDASHANTGTAALDLAGIVGTRTAMAKQTDDNSLLRDVMLRIVLVPEELRDTADNLAGSEYLPWPESAPGAQRVNTIRSTFTVTASPRLTDPNDWYAFDAPGRTIECAFLTGNRAPVVERESGWDTDAMHWKVRQPFVFYALDWRGCYRNVVI